MDNSELARLQRLRSVAGTLFTSGYLTAETYLATRVKINADIDGLLFARPAGDGAE